MTTVESRIYATKDVKITHLKQGSTTYSKMSFPIHCGIYSEIETKEFIFQFNLNSEIFRAKGKGREWAHPHEWLKRTPGNDWVYYSTGGYTGVFEATGEYYLPNFQYPTNSILGGHPFAHEEITRISGSWYQFLLELQAQQTDLPRHFGNFLNQVITNSPEKLEQKAQLLHEIIGGRISVLPPDARHVDYNIIPLTISEGCLYKCAFCKVKNNTVFTEKSDAEIRAQISRLAKLYGRDLINYNSLFLGEHDALQSSPERILFSIETACKEFDFDHSYTAGTNVFLFGSVTSLLNKPDAFFRQLVESGAMTYINIGLESADQQTLDKIGKPLTERLVQEAFWRGQDINDRFPSVEITANFIMDENLPDNHYKKILHLIREQQVHVKPKGSIYFSPLTFDRPSRTRLFEFNRIKIQSRLPTYLYIIQRF
ncbi:radical SAM domain-containing protein [Desulfopila sp. IMCC35006]|uniref:radical SAM protein n=1 Tax=Desulfopila sp. IMCC35006 TaxID=2569542 RepID=UPI0010AD5E87|nr:radical SAM protein [Desulfopila sp. IMCC35006]TKB25737.1 radical SAM domain-containing protein [Desulfopila sp. IMCC35006]